MNTPELYFAAVIVGENVDKTLAFMSAAERSAYMRGFDEAADLMAGDDIICVTEEQIRKEPEWYPDDAIAVIECAKGRQ